MSEEYKSKRTHVGSSSGFGVFWAIGWLFTIGFLKLIWWKAILALVFWPWYLGVALR